MRLADTLQKCLDDMGWEHTVERNEADQLARLHTIYEIHEQHFDLYLHTDESKDWIQVYLYAPFRARRAKHHDCVLLCNYINGFVEVGAIHVMTDGRIRFRHTVDVEATEPSLIMIRNLIHVAGDLFDSWLEELSAVALTKITAQDILELLDQPAPQGDDPGAKVSDPDASRMSGDGETPKRLH